MLSQNVVKWLLLTMKKTSPESVQICENREDSEASDRACIIKETSKEENVTEDTSDKDHQSCEKDESLIGSNSNSGRRSPEQPEYHK